MKTIWLNPTDYVTGDPSLRISYPYVSHPGTIVTCTSPGDLKWVSMSLPLPPNAGIEELVICYQVSDPRSFISQIRLTEMSTPNLALVLHDDPTDLKSASPVCYTSKLGGLVPHAAVTLSLRLNFQTTKDNIKLGAVGVKHKSTVENVQGPDWLINSETYAIPFGHPGEWDALAQSKVAFVTHCPVNGEYFDRCHALGIRCFPYTTFYQGSAGATYQDINLKDRPEFIARVKNGDFVRSWFWDSEDAKNIYMPCPNVQEYQDAMVNWVSKLMALGADGIFADNLLECPACYGAKLGLHDHIYPAQVLDHLTEDENNRQVQTHAMAMLLKRIRQVIKEHQPEGAILGNSGYPPSSLPEEFWQYIDADMLESYICTWAAPYRWDGEHTEGAGIDPVTAWEHWHKAGQMLQYRLQAGKQIQALSYLGHTSYSVREDAFFCYASARLAGFVWNGGQSLSQADNAGYAELYRLRLGKAVTEELISSEGVYYRVFECGMVAVNPESRAKNITITWPHPFPTPHFLDLFDREGAKFWTKGYKHRYCLDAVTYRDGRYGQRSIRCSIDTLIPNIPHPYERNGAAASQLVELNQAQPRTILVSGWSKAENVENVLDFPEKSDYSIYIINVIYDDGTSYYYDEHKPLLYAPFSCGTHDWEQGIITIDAKKPIKSIEITLLFRNRIGTIWFDDFSLKEEGNDNELLQNGGFEEVEYQQSIIDVNQTDGLLEVPKNSGRVYLFASDIAHQLTNPSFKLTVTTSPPLGEVCFRVDGFDYWTHKGHWKIEYELSQDFGKFEIVFDTPGKHTIEVVDKIAKDLTITTGYGSGIWVNGRDPSHPTKESSNIFEFSHWDGWDDKNYGIEVDVSNDTTLIAQFDTIPSS